MEEDLTDLIKDDDMSLLFDELPPTVFPPTSSSRMSPQQLSRSTSPPSSLMMSPRRPSRSASPLSSSRMSPQQACQSVPPLLPDKPLSNQIVSPIASPTDDTSSPPDHMESESQRTIE
ncbi:uncharacterized protein [Dysidea avara]|uniref:uncharacterized protein n=1 Tax=Dysidea avara TaxID=196820 RepID=UPI00331D9A8D